MSDSVHTDEKVAAPVPVPVPENAGAAAPSSQSGLTPPPTSTPNAPAGNGNGTVPCTMACRKLLDQVQVTYQPSYNNAVDVFVTCVNQEAQVHERARKFADPIAIEVNNLMQSLACWGLSRVRLSDNGFALRETSMFLNSLEQASFHLIKALQIDSTIRNDCSRRY